MTTQTTFEQPATLLDGKHYFLKISRDGGNIPVFIQITYIGVTTCPAVVVVEDARNNRFPCGRGDLFDLG